MSANGISKHFIKSKNWVLKTMSRDKLAPVSETGSQGGGRLGIPKMILLRWVEKKGSRGCKFFCGPSGHTIISVRDYVTKSHGVMDFSY